MVHDIFMESVHLEYCPVIRFRHRWTRTAIRGRKRTSNEFRLEEEPKYGLGTNYFSSTRVGVISISLGSVESTIQIIFHFNTFETLFEFLKCDRYQNIGATINPTEIQFYDFIWGQVFELRTWVTLEKLG